MTESARTALLVEAPAHSAVGRATHAPFVRLVFDAAILVVGLISLAGYFGAWAWPFDMVNFFRPHIAALALGLSLLAFATGGGRARIVAGVVVLAISTFPLLWPSAPMAARAKDGNFRVLSTNIMGAANHNKDAYRRLVADTAPDIVVAQEVAPIWKTVFKSLSGLPYSAGLEQPVGGTSIMVASRYPIKSETLYWGDQTTEHGIVGSPALRVEIERPGGTRPLILYAIHPVTPRSAAAWRVRNFHLDRIATEAAKDAKNAEVIVAGDWNTPYWSPIFARTLKTAGLKASERAWPAPTRIFREFGMPDFLGSPIDHVESTPGIAVAGLRVGGRFGSDHLPVIADLAVP